MPKQTTRWLYGMPFWHGVVYRTTIFSFKVVGFFLWRFQISGLKTLPNKEPFLLLGNHSSMLDPFWAGMYVPRGVKSMASATVLKVPYLGKFLTMCGCFPKMKYTKDRASMQLLQQNYDDGYPILLFPEGNRSWDGRIGPISKGIGRLIKRLDCPVVFFQLPTACLYQPRWAKYPRWVPVVIRYSEPHRYAESDSAEDIWRDVCQRIDTTPLLPTGYRTFGFRMAHGLPNYLWACPNCYTLDSLTVMPDNGNAVQCTDCNEEWVVQVDNRMVGQNTWTVREAFDRIAAHFGNQPKCEKEEFKRSGSALSCDNATIAKRSEKGPMEIIEQGTLSITKEGLSIHQKNKTWQVTHQEITAISVEIANLLQFRVNGVVHRMTTPNQSSLMWAFFLRGWQPIDPSRP